MSLRTSRWRSAVLLVAAVLLGAYSIAGVLTVGMLQGSGYQLAARIYLALLSLSVVVAVGVIVVRRRGRNATRPSI